MVVQDSASLEYKQEKDFFFLDRRGSFVHDFAVRGLLKLKQNKFVHCNIFEFLTLQPFGDCCVPMRTRLWKSLVVLVWHRYV